MSTTAALIAIREMHSESDLHTARGFCQDCGTSWPCRTRKAADVALAADPRWLSLLRLARTWATREKGYGAYPEASAYEDGIVGGFEQASDQLCEALGVDPADLYRIGEGA